MDYLPKKKFGVFITKLKETLDQLNTEKHIAFKRDQLLAKMIYESHFHPAGNLLCKVETNHAIKKVMADFKA